LEGIMKGQMQLHRPMERTPVGMVRESERERERQTDTVRRLSVHYVMDVH
jgi:hypothetical protein